MRSSTPRPCAPPPLCPGAVACYAPAEPHTTLLCRPTVPPLRNHMPRPCTAPHSAPARSRAAPQRGHMLRSRAGTSYDPAQPQSAPLTQPHSAPLPQPLYPNAAPRSPLRSPVLRPRVVLSCAHARPQAAPLHSPTPRPCTIPRCAPTQLHCAPQRDCMPRPLRSRMLRSSAVPRSASAEPRDSPQLGPTQHP